MNYDKLTKKKNVFLGSPGNKYKEYEKKIPPYSDIYIYTLFYIPKAGYISSFNLYI